MKNENLIELRNKIKEKNPDFIRQDIHKRKKLKLKWRKPKGIHSKIRHHFKGRRKMPSPGYKSPRAASGMHSSGLMPVMVFSVKDLTAVSKGKDGIIISGSVGMKKKYEILKKIRDFGLEVLNLNADKAMKKIEDFISSKKKKSEKSAKKEEPKKQEQKKEDSKESAKHHAAEKTDDESKKEAEKKARDEILTKRI